MTARVDQTARLGPAGIGPGTIVVSPYHITTREPASMVAFQLADRVTTLLLAPIADRVGVAVDPETFRRAFSRSGVYRRYLDSWAWARPLFDEGLVVSVLDGADPVEDVLGVCARIASDASLDALTRFMRPGVFEDDRVYLQAASADVLKAGPDPGVSIPIAAGLDAFAAARGLLVARSAPASVAQKAETRLGRRVFRVTIPVVLQGSADRVLLARVLLDEARRDLLAAIAGAFENGTDPRTAAARYAARFEAERGEICSPPAPHEEDEVRVVTGEVSVEGVVLPVDAVLISSVSAAGGRVASPGRDAGGGVHTLIVRIVGG